MSGEILIEADTSHRQPHDGKTANGCRRSETFDFFRAWLANPLRVASMIPSSNQLALAITREISASAAPVLELGPGTGVFTRALLARGVSEEDIVLIESGGEFTPRLNQQFPKAKLIQMDAAHLRSVNLFNERKAGVVISGLPLLSMSPRKITAVLRGAFHQMRHDGAIYQFTYGLRCPVPRKLLDRLGLKAVRISITYANLPPASVYRITRRRLLG